MAITSSSRAFNQDSAAAKRAAHQGPMFITDRGKPAHVPLSIEDPLRPIGGRGPIAEILSFPGAEAVELPWIGHPEPAQAVALR